MNIQKGQNPLLRHNYCTDNDVDSRLSFHCRGAKKHTSYRESAKVLPPPSPFRRAGEPCTSCLLNKIFAGSGRHSRRTTV